MPFIDTVRHPRVQPWMLAIVLGFVVIIGSLLLSVPFARDVLYNLWSSLAAILVFAGVVIHRPARRMPWLLFGLGLALMAIGDWTWTVIEHVTGTNPFPSIADAFYLMGELSMALGVLGILRNRLPGSDRAGILDALILATGFGVVCWVWFMGPLAGSSTSGVALGVSLA